MIVVFVLNIVFNHWTWRQPRTESTVDKALKHGVVAIDQPDGEVHPHAGDGQLSGADQPTWEGQPAG